MDHRSSAGGYGPTVVLTSRSGVVSLMEWDAFPAGAVTRGRAGRIEPSWHRQAAASGEHRDCKGHFGSVCRCHTTLVTILVTMMWPRGPSFSAWRTAPLPASAAMSPSPPTMGEMLSKKNV